MVLEMESSKTDVTSFMTFVTDWFVGVCGSLAQMLENKLSTESIDDIV